ncbi:MAG: ABC transporter permease, partial [Deltaproteobacteria bacterium]|nr:ABC transporter permease [Deltaproteobacteria bacterium]
MGRFRNTLLSLSLFVLVFGLMSPPNLVQAQQKEAPTQYVPALIYRTGPFAPGGSGTGSGWEDYMELINMKGGVNG